MAADIPQGRGKSPIANINVTPFVDVMLVLLVIFMVTAPIIQQGVEVNLPQAKASPVEDQEDPLIVTISREGQVYLNDNEMDPAELRSKLEAISRLNARKAVYLRADREVRYGSVIAAIGEIKAAGIERLGMIAAPVADR